MPVLILLLLLAGSLAAQHPGGLPFAGHAGRRPVSLDEAPDPSRPTLGRHGSPVWYWPDLPADSVFFRQSYTVPRSSEFVGLRLVTFGGQSGHATRGFWNLALRVNGTERLTVSDLLFSGAGEEEDYPVPFDGESGPVLGAGDQVVVELFRSHGNYPPYLAGDGDCLFTGGQQADLRLAGGGRQPLDRDLCIKLLVAYPAGDLSGPELEFPRLPDWPLANGTLPVRLHARDTAGVAHTAVRAWQEGGDTLEVAGVHGGVSGGDWLASLPLGGFAAGTLSLWYSASDSLGNASDSLATLELVEGDYLWSAASGRVDHSYTPGWPLLSGMATAVRVGLEDFPADVSLEGFVPRGGRTLLFGQGSCRMRLVPDRDGAPRTVSGAWLDATDPVELAGITDCGGWRTFQFGPVEDSLQTATAWWLIQEYNSGDGLFVAAEVPADTAGASGTSWTWNPQAGEWSPLEGLDLLHQVRVSVSSCDTDLPFLADFDSSYPELGCWELDRVAPGSQGWLLAVRDGQINPTSTYFAPLGDPEGTSAYGRSAASDMLHALSTIAFINSDDQPDQDLQDSLITPWIAYGADTNLQAAFFSYYGHLAGGTRDEEATVIRRVRSSGGVVGDWQVLASGAELGVSVPFTLDSGEETFRPVWTWHTLPLAGLFPGGSVQLGFVYSGQFAFGWALDSLRVEVPAAPVLPPGESVVSIERTWPNPFNPSTTIEFVLRQAGPVRVEVYNLLGQQVARLLDEPRLAKGMHQVRFQADGLASGIYFVRIGSRNQWDRRRIILVK